MVSYSTAEFKRGLKVLIDGAPCSIIEQEFVKPGKGQAFTRIKIRNLATGQVWEKTCKSGEKLEAADVLEIEAQFLYQDGTQWHFMKNDDSYEQLAVSSKILGDNAKWMQEGTNCTITLHNNIAIVVEPPQTIESEVVETDSGMKGDTVSGGNKPATLETGAKIKVPLFVQPGERVRVNTSTGEYLGRANK